MHNILHSLTSSQGNMGLLPFKVQQVPLKKKRKRNAIFWECSATEHFSLCSKCASWEGKFALATSGCENKPDAAWGRNFGF